MLTSEQRASIRAEEIFRREVQRELASLQGDRRISRKLWDFFNTSLGIWFLSSIVLGLISWQISHSALNREHGETLRRLKWEAYNNGLEFEEAIGKARNRSDYELAFATVLQNRQSRLFDYKTFGLDRITFEVEFMGTSNDQADAKTARWAASKVWELIHEEFKSKEDWRAEDWRANLERPRKEQLDKDIREYVQKYIVDPFKPS